MTCTLIALWWLFGLLAFVVANALMYKKITVGDVIMGLLAGAFGPFALFFISVAVASYYSERVIWRAKK